jgi:adenylylsulfate kinase-like enzyme
MIYYLIGQPHAGKTTLSKLLKQHLYPQNIIQIDGDDLRDIFQNKDYSEEGRRNNIRRAQDIAMFLNAKGIDVIISLVSPYKDLRDELKGKSNVIEIYVHTDDVRGREGFHVENYEKPTENYIDIDTTGVSEFTSLGELITKINEYGNK